MDKTIALFGAGNVAEALISGITRSRIIPPERLLVTNRKNKARLNYIEDKYGVRCTHEAEQMLVEADILILAMKPYDASEYLEWLKHHVTPGHLIISVIAGLSIEQIESALGSEVKVIRSMPNTSALVGESATGMARGTHVSDDDLLLAETLLETLGLVKIVKEKDLHMITAIAGSGPAFFYYMIEAMEEVAVESGVDSAAATELLTQTLIGAGKMLKSSGETPEQLRINITSPAGVTDAGLKQLESDDFKKILRTGIRRARDRSIEISEELDE